MLAEPVSDGDGRADRASDEQAFTSANQAADEHSAASTHSNFSQILAIMTSAFELSLGVDVGAAPLIGVYQRGVESEAVAVREDQVFGKDRDGRLARDAAWLSRLGHAAFDGGANRDH